MTLSTRIWRPWTCCHLYHVHPCLNLLPAACNCKHTRTHTHVHEHTHTYTSIHICTSACSVIYPPLTAPTRSVAVKDVSEAIYQQTGRQLAEADFKIPDIKTVGTYECTVKLHPEVKGTFSVVIVKDKTLTIKGKK